MNRRDKKAAVQMNAKSITDSQLDGAHVGLIFTSKLNVLCGPHSCVRFMR